MRAKDRQAREENERLRAENAGLKEQLKQAEDRLAAKEIDRVFAIGGASSVRSEALRQVAEERTARRRLEYIIEQHKSAALVTLQALDEYAQTEIGGYLAEAVQSQSQPVVVEELVKSAYFVETALTDNHNERMQLISTDESMPTIERLLQEMFGVMRLVGVRQAMIQMQLVALARSNYPPLILSLVLQQLQRTGSIYLPLLERLGPEWLEQLPEAPATFETLKQGLESLHCQGLAPSRSFDRWRRWMKAIKRQTVLLPDVFWAPEIWRKFGGAAPSPQLNDVVD